MKRVTAVLKSYGEDREEDGFGLGPDGFPLAGGRRTFQVREEDEQMGQCGLMREAGPFSQPPGGCCARSPW